MSAVTAEFWELAARNHVHPYFFYVPSELNIIDGFSRSQSFSHDPFGNQVQMRAPQFPAGWPKILSTV
jgi:hypothetical protein